MSEEKSLLKKVFDYIDEVTDPESGKTIIILGVEIDENGIPESQATKVMGTPANSLGGITLMSELLSSAKEDILSRIKERTSSNTIERSRSGSSTDEKIIKNMMTASEDSQKELFMKMSLLEKAGLLDEFYKSLDDEKEVNRIKNIMKDMKKKFGK